MDGVPLLTVPDRLLVWGRAGVLGSVALGTGVVSHVAGGGRLPGLPGLALLLAVSVLVATRFLTGRVSAPRLVLLVVAGQTLTHAALSVLAGHRGSAAAPTAPHLHEVATEPATATATGTGTVAAHPPAALGEARRTGNLYDQYLASVQDMPASGPGSAQGSSGWLTHQVEHLGDQGLLMVLAHLCGAVALGLFLAMGERALWRLLLLVAARRVVGLAADRVLCQAAAVAAGLRVPSTPAHEHRLPLSDSQVLACDARRLRAPPFLLAA